MLEPVQEDIQRGCVALGLAPDVAVAERLAALVALLVKWNRVYNLTAVREPHAMVVRHILDSLVVLPFLTSGRLLDAGTGAGLPGLPIAIVRPDLSLTLLDSNAKKLRFVRQAATELGLDNLDVVQQRMEQYRPAQSFDMVISRAVASIGAMYRDTARRAFPVHERGQAGRGNRGIWAARATARRSPEGAGPGCGAPSGVV